jgi:glucan phosphoethanolaminetransferase (alkaline phosphatase superfamily)
MLYIANFLSLSHKKLKIFLVILLFFSTINLYIRNKYGYILDEIMMANALDSLGHINDATDYNLIINLLFFSIIPSIIIIKIKFHKNNFKIKSFSILLALILIGILIIFSPKFVTNYAVNSISPSSYISASYRYYQRFRDVRLISKNRQSLTKFYNFSQQNISEKNQMI